MKSDNRVFSHRAGANNAENLALGGKVIMKDEIMRMNCSALHSNFIKSKIIVRTYCI